MRAMHSVPSEHSSDPGDPRPSRSYSPGATLRVRAPGAIPPSTHKDALSAAQMDAARDGALFGHTGATQLLHAEALETPLLSADEERALFARVRQGDAAALDHAIRANVRLVGAVARFYLRGVSSGASGASGGSSAPRGGGAGGTGGSGGGLTLDLDDLMQEGMLGLWKAAQRFDPALGNRFSTYATWWIRQSVTRALVNSGSAIRLPAHLDQRCRQIMRVRSALELELGRAPSAQEIAQRLTCQQGHRTARGGWGAQQLTAQEVEEALAAWALRRAPLSLEAEIIPHAALGARSGTGNDHGADGFTLRDLLADPDAEEAFAEAETRADATPSVVGGAGGVDAERVDALIVTLRARGQLTARDVEIVLRRALRGESRAAVSHDLGISRQRVEQLEQRAYTRIQRERAAVRRRRAASGVSKRTGGAR
jgi:RNA polymerase sigma factor (sigma-70 family)